MFNILDYKKVINFLGGNTSIFNQIKDLSDKEKIRKILGDPAYDSIITNMFIFSANDA